jgi:hypothetical protein
LASRNPISDPAPSATSTVSNTERSIASLRAYDRPRALHRPFRGLYEAPRRRRVAFQGLFEAVRRRRDGPKRVFETSRTFIDAFQALY